MGNNDVIKDIKFNPNQFYGIQLNREQIEFAEAIYNPKNLCILCNARAGTGKTLVSVGVANLLVQLGYYDKLYYIVSPTQELVQGYLPGSQEEKSQVYAEPLVDALVTIGVNPNVAIVSDTNYTAQKTGKSYIHFMTHTYMRGMNIERSVVLLEESQNFTADQLKKVLTRVHDSCKTIVIGHSGQIDMLKHPERSGFEKLIDLFKNKGSDFSQVVELYENHRGKVSLLADEL